jgi:4-deoxy-L-threo-5-hexosulose-uronate ketol-isomerase
MNTQELRDSFLIEKLMNDEQAKSVYSHYDRMIIAGIKPVRTAVALPNYDELKAAYFLERREAGIINIGGDGIVEADGQSFSLQKLDCVYLGKGVKQVNFKSVSADKPAMFYLLSSPAHKTYSNQLLKKENASPVSIGEIKTANQRTIYKYIHAEGIESCQLVMGLTVLQEGSVWNTMPAHTHTRRMEAYFYFDLATDQRVIHLMGEPKETRHLLVSNQEAVISAPWSIHSGCGTGSYSFIWGMAGENYTYTDMDPFPAVDLR